MTAQNLGEFLREERERRGITLEQVASATKISIRLLHALEANHYAELPAVPFIRGFVTSYARFIGLDPREVLSNYLLFVEEKSKERPDRTKGHSGYAFEKKEGDQTKTMLWLVMGGFAVLGGIVLALKPSLRHHHGSHLDKLRAAHAVASPLPSPTQKVALASTPASLPSAKPSLTSAPALVAGLASEHKPSPAVTPTTTVKPTATPEPSPVYTQSPDDPLNSGKTLKISEIKYKFLIKAAADVWVRYRVDDRAPMKFILRKDKILVLRATHVVLFQASNPKAAILSYNGGTYRPLSEMRSATERQGVLTLIYPKELAEITQEPFPSERQLPHTAPPPHPTPDPLSTPSQ